MCRQRLGDETGAGRCGIFHTRQASCARIREAPIGYSDRWSVLSEGRVWDKEGQSMTAYRTLT